MLGLEGVLKLYLISPPVKTSLYDALEVLPHNLDLLLVAYRPHLLNVLLLYDLVGDGLVLQLRAFLLKLDYHLLLLVLGLETGLFVPVLKGGAELLPIRSYDEVCYILIE